MSLKHSVRNLRKTSQTADGNIQSASITCWKALRAKNTSLRMDRSVKPLLMWWIMQSGTLSASETATLGLQHHGQFRDCRIGFFQHLALCVASPNCIYSSHFDVTPSLSRCTHVTLLSVSRFFCCSAFAVREADNWILHLSERAKQTVKNLWDTFYTAGAHSHKNNITKQRSNSNLFSVEHVNLFKLVI